MTQTHEKELSAIKSELGSIISQIINISDDLNGNKSIGIEKCSQSLKNISQDYRYLLSRLEQIDLDPDNTSGGGRF